MPYTIRILINKIRNKLDIPRNSDKVWEKFVQ